MTKVTTGENSLNEKSSTITTPPSRMRKEPDDSCGIILPRIEILK